VCERRHVQSGQQRVRQDLSVWSVRSRLPRRLPLPRHQDVPERHVQMSEGRPFRRL
jgi:hypothetical protein